MKRTSNIFLVFLAFVFAVTVLIPPPQAQALGKNPQCDAFQGKRDQVVQGIDRKKPALDTLRTTNKFNMAQERSTTQQKNTSTRVQQDKQRSALYEKLRAKAKTQTKTPAQREAVEQYIQSVEAAVLKRRSSHDIRQTAFNTAFDALVAKQRAGVDGDIVTLKDSITKLTSTAITDCEVRGPDKVFEEVLSPGVVNADKTFLATNANVTNLQKSIKTLVDARKDAMTVIDKDFKASTTDARLVLKSALGNDVKYIIE